ncbi:type II toxin-antitoxin system Phd/YefM family antitoxin [Brevundimonas sp. GCM10030266]|uniref:type II toxin-antitoxin system Phd/YefM family antitoxin n=1 Tax=Brevundimonas sp. GCM10030266 TaxID=3273386 RepID=UPI00361B408E
MRTVGVLEAKTNLSALLDDVEATGEVIVITRHGKAVARLTPEPVAHQPSALSVAERARAFRDRQAPDPEWASLSWEELKAIARDEAGR